MPPVAQNQAGSTSVSAILDWARALFFDRRYFWVLAGLLAVGEAALGTLIIWKVPCRSRVTRSVE